MVDGKAPSKTEVVHSETAWSTEMSEPCCLDPSSIVHGKSAVAVKDRHNDPSDPTPEEGAGDATAGRPPAESFGHE